MRGEPRRAFLRAKLSHTATDRKGPFAPVEENNPTLLLCAVSGLVTVVKSICVYRCLLSMYCLLAGSGARIYR